MAGSVTGLHTFGPDTGPEALSLLDGNYSLLTNAVNALSSFSNYYVDSSGAPNAITVTVAAPQTFAYVAGIALQVKLANTNTATAVNINVNGLGNKAVLLNDGVVPPVGSLTVGSILYLQYDGTNFYVIGQRASNVITTGLFGDGAVGSPSISFALDTDTGFYRGGANRINVALGGANTAIFLADRFYSPGGVSVDDGSIGTPAFRFENDTDTGIYRSAANTAFLVAGGAEALGWDTVGVYIRASHRIFNQDGTAGAPSYTYDNDPDTGLYRDTANQIAIALGGVTAGQIAANTFTLTIAGITGTPGVTASWQQIGKHIFVSVAAGATAATTGNMSLSGIPAAIRPPANRYAVAAGLVKNSVLILGQGVVSAAGGCTISAADGTTVATGTCGLDNGFTLIYPII